MSARLVSIIQLDECEDFSDSIPSYRNQTKPNPHIIAPQVQILWNDRILLLSLLLELLLWQHPSLTLASVSLPPSHPQPLFIDTVAFLKYSLNYDRCDLPFNTFSKRPKINVPSNLLCRLCCSTIIAAVVSVLYLRLAPRFCCPHSVNRYVATLCLTRMQSFSAHPTLRNRFTLQLAENKFPQTSRAIIKAWWE